MQANTRSVAGLLIGGTIGIVLALLLGWDKWPLNRHDYVLVAAMLVGAFAGHKVTQRAKP